MPRRAQPPTPDDLPAVPKDSRKKQYYPAGNKVYYYLRGSSEWRMGTVSNETSSTQLHVIKDDTSGQEENVNAEYIRERT